MLKIKIPRYPLIFLKVLISYVFISLSIKVFNPRFLLKLLNQGIKSRVDYGRIEKVFFYSSFIMSLWPWRITKTPCLLRSLVLFRCLRSEGLKVSINFGIRYQESLLSGHSWLTLEGRPYCESKESLGKFDTVYAFP